MASRMSTCLPFAAREGGAESVGDLVQQRAGEIAFAGRLGGLRGLHQLAARWAGST